MRSTLEGKVTIVTGAASGIGEGICRRFAASGAEVVVADIDEERGEKVADALGARARFRRVDVTREEDVRDAVADAIERTGRLDCIVNNAGAVGSWRFVHDIPTDEWDAAFRLLCRSAFLGIKYAAPVMRARGAGSIINTGSVAGKITGFGPHPYSAAKAAISHLTRTAAVELAESGVRVNCLVPGGVATRITGYGAGKTGRVLDESVEHTRRALKSLQPIRRSGEPDDLAAAAEFLASDASGFVTGQDIVVDGGASLGRDWPEDARRIAVKLDQSTEGGAQG